MCDMAEFLRMSNPIQHYAWGSCSVLATMQGRSTPTSDPEAELWMGAHPSAPSHVEVGGSSRGLHEVAPHLPFLLKILAIAAPLSIQVHPSTEQAREGYAREDRAGVPLDSPRRNYKDERAKPETVVALSEMWLLVGQRQRRDLARLAERLQLPWLAEAAAADCPVQHALELPDDDAAAAVRATVTAAARLADAEGVPRELSPHGDPVQRAAALTSLLSHHYPGDRGLLVALCMNVVHLDPGQALFTPAQQVHAYLSGTAVEIMACSDNVLRAGLTPKHVDVPELLRIMSRTAEPVEVFEPRPESDGVVHYPLWDPAVTLTAARVAPGAPVRRELAGTCMVLVTEGEVTVAPGGLRAAAGESLICLDGPTTVTVEGSGQVFLVAAAPAREG
ncbi:mannose-6-phosphate isomerase, class I [Kocuria varians]|uniref:mannose-6-phosphate isomerase n=2 Tax=Kocuria varians TaxID=1272 RepID=A0A4Y4D3I4_KOCVA|nr:mannose-6-phosphate isomerase, class I [Kocuria varians]